MTIPITPTEIEELTNDELDKLPFGAIQLDTEGNILRFNEYEANLSNRRAPEAIGKNFFNEVAPCTRVQQFHGRFLDAIENKTLQVEFPFHFQFEQMLRTVTVSLYYSVATDTVWVFVQEKN